MGNIIHDTEALDLLRRGLIEILEDITGPQRSVFELSANEAGHEAAAIAVSRFYDGWNEGRERVAESVRTHASNLELVIQCYEDVEGSVCGAFARVGATLGP